MYDLYLLKCCNYIPDLQYLASQIPAVTYEVFQQWLITEKFEGPGFLQLQLEHSLAEILLERLQQAGGRGIILKAAYCRPRFTFEEALSIASSVISEQQAHYFSSYAFSSVTLSYEQPDAWYFSAVSEQLIAEGFVPGAISVKVDKLDGYVPFPDIDDLEDEEDDDFEDDDEDEEELVFDF